MNQNEALEATENDEHHTAGVATPENADDAPEADTADAPTIDALQADNDKLTAEIAKLKDENARRRIEAQNADDLRRQLHRAWVEMDARLADPDDLSFDATRDRDDIATAITELLDQRPHLKSRRPQGDIGQGHRGTGQPASLLSILKQFS